jgi:hypothetical protein
MDKRWSDINTPQTFVGAYIEAFAPEFLPVGHWTLVDDYWVGWITDFRCSQRVRLQVDPGDPGDPAELVGHLHYGLRYRRHLGLRIVDARIRKRPRT